MSRQTATEQLLDEISAFTRRLRALFDVRARATGLTLPRARALFALRRLGAMSQKDLASELEIETPTLVRVLDGMERQGLIERRAEQGDRRIKQIHMTAEGIETSEAVQAVARQLREELVEDISEQDLAMALDVLRRMSRKIQAIGAEGRQ